MEVIAQIKKDMASLSGKHRNNNVDLVVQWLTKLADEYPEDAAKTYAILCRWEEQGAKAYWADSVISMLPHTALETLENVVRESQKHDRRRFLTNMGFAGALFTLIKWSQVEREQSDRTKIAEAEEQLRVAKTAEQQEIAKQRVEGLKKYAQGTKTLHETVSMAALLGEGFETFQYLRTYSADEGRKCAQNITDAAIKILPKIIQCHNTQVHSNRGTT